MAEVTLRWCWLTLPLLACAPLASEPSAPCNADPPAAGEIVVGTVACRAQLFGSGEGGGADIVLANSRFRAILRHPLAALTVPGLGGGTIADAAPWGAPDHLHEIVPLVDGGWLDVDDAAIEADGVVLTGDLRQLPDRPIAATGRRTVAWRIRADDPWLHLEGADGFYVHPSVAMDLLDGWLADSQVVYGHDGQVDVDLGGAVRISGATRLLIAAPTEAWAERSAATVHVAGAAPGASTIEAFRDGVVVARLPVLDGVFDARLPADVTELRATAPGHAPGPTVAPGEALALTLGPSGSIHLRFALGRAPDRPIPVSWSTADGRVGQGRLDVDGGTLTLGAGVFDLVVGALPYVVPVRTRVEVAPNAAVDLDVALADAVVPLRHVLANLAWPGSRSRTIRDAAVERTRDAANAGLSYVVATAEDDVETVATYLDDVYWIRTDSGLTLTHPDGWRITSWPWGATPDRAAHGAPTGWLMSPKQAFDVVRAGPVDRTTRVDLAWMRAVTDPPLAFEDFPDFIALDAPGAAPFDAWAPWFAWLDAGRFVRPSGPLDWLDVGPTVTYGRLDVERALSRGRLCAGTGGFLDLRIDGAAPGAIVPLPPVDTDTSDTDALEPADTDAAPDTDGALPPTDHLIQWVLDSGPYPLDRVTLFTEGAGVLQTIEVAGDGVSGSGRAMVGAWTIAVAWSTTSDDWAVTAPIWTRAPSVGVIPGTATAR